MSLGWSKGPSSCECAQRISVRPGLHLLIEWVIGCNCLHHTNSETEDQEGEFMHPNSYKLLKRGCCPGLYPHQPNGLLGKIATWPSSRGMLPLRNLELDLEQSLLSPACQPVLHAAVQQHRKNKHGKKEGGILQLLVCWSFLIQSQIFGITCDVVLTCQVHAVLSCECNYCFVLFSF